MGSLNRLIDEVVQANRDLPGHRLVTLSWGNVSVQASKAGLGIYARQNVPNNFGPTRITVGSTPSGDPWSSVNLFIAVRAVVKWGPSSVCFEPHANCQRP